jgi:nucleoside-diphosphate-sugar epimerase
MVQLLVGGSGYLGVALAGRLLQRGIQVRVYDLVRSPQLPDEVDFIGGDVRDLDRLREVTAGCDIVHHLVGIMPQARASREIMQAVNVKGTENVLRAASDQGAKRVVFASSSEVYGRPRTIPIKENDPLEPIGEYGYNKVAAEQLCHTYRKETGIEAIILRPPTIVGPGMTEKTFFRNMEMARRGRFICIGSGNSRFQMLHVDDAAEACALAAEKDDVDGEAFNIGSEGTLPFRKQLEEIARRLGREARIRSIPTLLFKGIIRILQPLGLSPLEPDHLHLLYSDFVMDVTKARERLGWVPTKTNVEMLIETYDWYVRTH